MRTLRQRFNQVAPIVVVILSGGLAVYAALLLFGGQPMRAGETTDANPLQVIPVYEALFPLLAALLILGGFLRRNLLFAWGGGVLLSVFSLLFAVGVGASFLLPSILLLILISLYSFLQTKQPDKKYEPT